MNDSFGNTRERVAPGALGFDQRAPLRNQARWKRRMPEKNFHLNTRIAHTRTIGGTDELRNRFWADNDILGQSG